MATSSEISCSLSFDFMSKILAMGIYEKLTKLIDTVDLGFEMDDNA